MKNFHTFTITILIFLTLIGTGCSNIPQAPTATPTMSEAEMIQAAEETAMAVFSMTQTQDALMNPSATPEPTETAAPLIPPTIPAPVIPPTVTAEAKPYLSVGYKNCYISKDGVEGYKWVPYDRLYIEVCFTNDGSGTWNQNYFAQVTLNDGGNTSPPSVLLGKNVAPGEKACFSFNQNMAGYELGQHQSVFALTTDSGAILNEGYIGCYWTVY